MIEVIYKDGEFLAKGSFFVGIAGTYVNEAFGDEKINIMCELEDVLEELEDEESFFYRALMPYLEEKMEDDDEDETEEQGKGDAVAHALEAYYNEREKQIKANKKQVNDCFLYHMFEGMINCGYPFWEIEQAVIPGTLDMSDLDVLEKQVYRKDTWEVDDWYKYFYKIPNNGTVKKIDVEARLREMFPMFNFDSLFASIVPEYLTLDNEYICFQCSDGWGEELLCGAYDELDENLVFTEWHNF
uniref:hypothetical protein n=1 Tax=Agathobacter sp. TaxID=2021311 RepID=UPI004057AE37